MDALGTQPRDDIMHCRKAHFGLAFRAVKRQIKDGISFFQFDHFPNHRRTRHAVFTRQGGISGAPFDSLNLSASVPDDRSNVYANRARAYQTHGRSNDTLVHAYLEHGAKVAVVTRANDGQHVGPVDGLITNEPGCGLTMNYADCAAIFIYDSRLNVIGLGHAGWRGVIDDLPGAMVRAMVRAFDSRPEDLLAGVGPCIGPCCYQVGEPVISSVQRVFDDPESLLISPPGHKLDSQVRLHLDLPEANRRRLVSAGVRQIELAGLCTACRTDLFFSHRAEQGRTGRFGVLFLLEE